MEGTGSNAARYDAAPAPKTVVLPNLRSDRLGTEMEEDSPARQVRRGIVRSNRTIADGFACASIGHAGNEKGPPRAFAGWPRLRERSEGP